MSVLQAALDAMSAGISVMPPAQDGSKRPDGNWKHAQSVRATETQILEWYKSGRTGVGWFPGAVSGNLEVLDFDDRSIWSEFQKLCREAGIGPLLDRVIAGYYEHTPNGAHLIYRCTTIDTNKKLAKKKTSPTDRKSLIETRGEGGYIIVAPSYGSVHPRGGTYTLQSGGISSIAEITPEERRSLFNVARMFDECPRTEEAHTSRMPAAGDRPGDDFNSRATWEEILEPHWWVKVSSRLGVTSWRRPGKDHGISATTNYADSGLLYVFSTSTMFESERGYSKFSAYAKLNCNDDYKAAKQDLLLNGYGVQPPDRDPDVDLSLLLSSRERAKAPADLAGLLRVPGLVGELAEWINVTSHKAQPVLALGASIAAIATLIGRKVRTETGLRSNLYVLGVGETGCGKERARQAIGRLFMDLGLSTQLGDSFASDAAVETAIMQSPVRLFLIDELGYFLGTMRDELAPAHVRSIVPMLLKLYSSSEGVYRRRTYAVSEKRDTEQAYVDQPCLSIYGTTVPSNFYANITKAHITNGLLSRLLVFESEDPDPLSQWITDDGATPSRILDGCRMWADATYNVDEAAGNIEARTVPSPRKAIATSGAREAFDDLEASMRARRAEERAAGRDHGPYTRVVAAAWKLALVRGCGVNPERPEITVADAEWGCGMAWGLTDRFMSKVGDAAPENKVEAANQKVASIIRAAGAIDHRGLMKRLRMLSRAQIADVLASLTEAGDIALDDVPTKGRPKKVYRWTSDGTKVFGRNKVEPEAVQN